MYCTEAAGSGTQARVESAAGDRSLAEGSGLGPLLIR